MLLEQMQRQKQQMEQQMEQRQTQQMEQLQQEQQQFARSKGIAISRYMRDWQESSTSLVRRSRVILPGSRFYSFWKQFILISATYSSIFTPIEFGFFRGLPKPMAIFDSSVQLIFLADVVVNFMLAFRDKRTYTIITSHRSIALRYLKTDFFLDFLACFPWDLIYRAAGNNEVIRYMLWIRLYRVRKVERFFQELEKNMSVNYFVSRIAKLLAVEFYCTHTAACIFYYLATSVPRSRAHYTWIGSLELGGFSYEDFHNIGLGKKYVTALYWAVLTMATVGYGDIHAVNPREMLFVMVFVSFDMILGAYLIGNMTALIVKGSSTEKYRDRMTSVLEFANLHQLPKQLRNQMKDHVNLEFEGQLAEKIVLKEFPASIRTKVSKELYKSSVQAVSLFENCSSDFINQIVGRVHREFFLPGEVIMEQGSASDRLYIVFDGLLEQVSVLDGSEEVATIAAHDIFGEVGILCNIPQPYTVRVKELSSVLRIDRQALTTVMQVYAVDGNQVLSNMLRNRSTDARIDQFVDDIHAQLLNQQAELTSKMNNATYQGDYYYVKSLLRAGVDPAAADYCGKTPLHLAAAQGYEDIVLLLLREGAKINAADNTGSTPLLEALKHGHDYTASLLVERDASLMLRDPGSMLCNAVVDGNLELLRRLILYGADPNATDYDLRAPLHIAAAEGLHLFVKFLISVGAYVQQLDRWGHTPLDEAKRCGSKLVISSLEEALEKPPDAINLSTKKISKTLIRSRGHAWHKELARVSRSRQLSCQCNSREASTFALSLKQQQQHQNQRPDQQRLRLLRSCILVPGHPLSDSAQHKHGILVTIPENVEELLEVATELFGDSFSRVLNAAGEEITSFEGVKSTDRLFAVPDDEQMNEGSSSSEQTDRR